jgi:S-layer homology domain.
MLKKMLSLLLVALMLTLTVSSSTIVKAEEINTNRANQVITALGIMKTDDASKAQNYKGVTRAEFAQMLVKMSTYKDLVGQDTNVSLFKDVSKKHWAVSYIKVAINEQWMSGYLTGKFMPDKYITLQEAVNGVVKLLGYTNTDFSGNKNAAKIALYYSKNIDEYIKTKSNAAITKADCTNLLYNTLKTTNKAGVVYGTTLGYTLDATGEIDYLSLISKKMKGPIIAKLGWESNLPFSADSAVYYRNSILSNKASIQNYDVLYYSETLKTVWAYSDKVTGTVDKISPDRQNPTEIVIAGNTLKIGTQDMSFAFSTMGSVKTGDIVTVLLGKDGTVVGVLSQSEYNTMISGVVVKAGKKLFDQNETTTALKDYVVVVDSNGRQYTFEYTPKNKNEVYKEGGIVKAKYDKDGNVNIDYSYERYLDPISGKVNDDGTKMGQYGIAKDVNIIDVQGDNYKRIYLPRIEGAQISASDVFYYSLNSSGEVQDLILNDYTGDLSKYGILLNVDTNFIGDDGTNTYKYLIKDVEQTGTTSDSTVQLNTGAAGFSFENGQLKTVKNLQGMYITSISGLKIVTGWDTRILSDDVSVYYVKDSKYYLTKLNKVSDLSKYNLLAFYDKSPLQAGRVRVIIAQDK